jgi:hypothetical protein
VFAYGFAAIVTLGNLSFPLAFLSGAAQDDACFEQGDRVVPATRCSPSSCAAAR